MLLRTTGFFFFRLVLSAFVLCALVLSASTTVGAQQPDDATELLRQRVVEELLSEGISLVRLGHRIEIKKSVEGTVKIVLVENASERIVDIRRLSDLSEDREAAIAEVTVVVAGMIREAELTSPGRQVPPSARDVVGIGANQPNAAAGSQTTQAASEAEFRRRLVQIEFDEVEAARTRTAYLGTGPTRQLLERDDFYDAVGRPDLARTLRRRTTIWKVALGVSMVSILGTVGTGVGAISASQKGSEASTPLGVAAISLAGVGIVALATGFVFAQIADPLDDAEASSLAKEYNENLREELGLKSSRLRLRNIRPVPYATAEGGGLLVGGSF